MLTTLTWINPVADFGYFDYKSFGGGHTKRDK